MPKDSSAAAMVVEQLARLAPRTNLDHTAQNVDQHLGPMIVGLLRLLVPPGGHEDRTTGVLLEGWLTYPKSYFVNTELIWGTPYLLFVL